MGTVEFDVFDADNHYYEATDAFIRHLPKHRSKLVQWADVDGKQRMIVDNKLFRFIPNPTFDPVARPGCLDEYFRGKKAGDDILAAFGELEQINAAYREPGPRIAEAGILAAYHSGDAGYNRYADEWGGGGDFQAFRNDPFRTVTGGHRPIYDTVAALACHGVLRRHPNLRVATIESGSEWVGLLLKALKKSYGQLPGAYEGVDPVEQVQEHVWVSPYYEDDLDELRNELGATQMIFGSDYPHAEGLADPKSFVDDLPNFSEEEIRLVMRENGLALSQPRA